MCCGAFFLPCGERLRAWTATDAADSLITEPRRWPPPHLGRRADERGELSEAPIHILRGARRARPGAVATPSTGDTTHAPALSESPVAAKRGVLVSDSQCASRKHNSHTSVRNESPPFLRRSPLSMKHSAKASEPSAAPYSAGRRPYFCDGRASPSPGNSKRQRRSELSGRRFFCPNLHPIVGAFRGGAIRNKFQYPRSKRACERTLPSLSAPGPALSAPLVRR